MPVQPLAVPATVVPLSNRTVTSAQASGPRPATATRNGTRPLAGTTAFAAGHSSATCGTVPLGELNDARFHGSALPAASSERYSIVRSPAAAGSVTAAV